MNINNHRKFKQNWTNNTEYVHKQMPYVFFKLLVYSKYYSSL